MRPPKVWVAYESSDGSTLIGDHPKMSFEQILHKHYLAKYKAQKEKSQRHLHKKQNNNEEQPYYSSKTPWSMRYNPSISDQSLKNYIDNHRIWYPKFHVKGFSTKTSKKLQTPSLYTMNREDEGFINYLHVPLVLGNEPLPPLIHHTTTSVGGYLFIFGGAHCLIKTQTGASNEIDENTKSLYKNYEIKPSIKLPFPLDLTIIHNPSMTPSSDLFIIAGDTNHVSKPEISGDIPPPLLCVSSSEISQRYIFYYGGFYFDDNIEYVKTDDEGYKFVITRNIKLNQYGYILDTYRLNFKRLELVAHPTILTKHPITVPRFGHSSTSINLSGKDGLNLNSPATVFIMGGYKKNDLTNKFEIIGDLWRVEFPVQYFGKNNYIQFGETILATPIHQEVDGDFLIPPRAFHISDVSESSETPTRVNPNKVGVFDKHSHNRFSDLTSDKSFRSTSSQISGLQLIFHGGTDGDGILGDVWWFDLDQETWKEVDTFCLEGETDYKFFKDSLRFKCQVKQVGHHSIVIDRYIILFGGVIPTNFNEDVIRTGIPDISDIYVNSKYGPKDQKLFVLDLKTHTWVMITCIHDLEFAENIDSTQYSRLGVLGSTITSCNSKVFLVGGLLVQNKLVSSDRIDVINNGVVIYEFPLGSLTNAAIRRIL